MKLAALLLLLPACITPDYMEITSGTNSGVLWDPNGVTRSRYQSVPLLLTLGWNFNNTNAAMTNLSLLDIDRFGRLSTKSDDKTATEVNITHQDEHPAHTVEPARPDIFGVPVPQTPVEVVGTLVVLLLLGYFGKKKFLSK